MTTFSKKISKILPSTKNCLVIGDGFNFLNEILNSFQTVFIICKEDSKVRHKNLIYRESFDSIYELPDLDAIFVDLSKLDKLGFLHAIWTKNKPPVIVEGPRPISREPFESLYKFKYNFFLDQKKFHLWTVQ
jgi:hypothetical protein